MRLSNDEINRAAAELLGLCWEHDWTRGDTIHQAKCKNCASVTPHLVGSLPERPDFIHDANASRRLAVWLINEYPAAVSGGTFTAFLDRELSIISPAYALAAPPKHITLAVLYAVGKITLEQAREAMEGDDE